MNDQPLPSRDPSAVNSAAWMNQWSGERTEYPRDASLVSLFEQMAEQFPGRTAICFGRREISYSELNLRANRLANRLLRLGARPELLIGICAERSLEMIVGILAILKTGSAYVPFDAAYPRERIDFMIADTSVPIMLTQRKFAHVVDVRSGMQSIWLDDVEPGADIRDEQNPQDSSNGSSLAYVMYTSGSTGRPKGVMVEQRSVTRLVCNTNYCSFGPDEVFLQLAPTSFDASTFEIWGALLHGAKLVVMPPQAPSLEEIGNHIREYGVTTLWLTAGLFHLFVDQRLEDLRPLRQLLAGGDLLSSPHVRKVLDSIPDITLINGYGPTENTTFTSCHVMHHGDAVASSVSIGRPISNSFVYLLDESLRPVAAGEVGELCAGGDGVARGYLNSPDLTGEKFPSNPFSDLLNGRLYRTGDLARWNADGTLEFLGRRDNQVKILGHRIELGEIETALAQHRAVKQTCVVAKADATGTKKLIAYYVPEEESNNSTSELRSFLAAKLPAYMVPVSFEPMSALPLTPNGKVDRAALPAPRDTSVALAPQSQGTELEESIACLWKEVLGTRRVGLDENFFDLGGDSLLIVAIHAQLQKLLQREIQLMDLFEYVTVRSLARHLGTAPATAPTFTAAQEQARKQREALAKRRLVRGMTP